jgi:CheY-like chemotaxis protein
VLVVDDNATNRRVLALQTGKWGMESRATDSPAEALRWLDAGEAFDLAILDMHMPEMDGVALAGKIREHRAALPLVLFSSLGRREAGVGDGLFDAYLGKPIISRSSSTRWSACWRMTLRRSPPLHRRRLGWIRRWPPGIRCASCSPRTTW